MVIKKIEIRPKGTGDYADVLYPKTSVDMVEGLETSIVKYGVASGTDVKTVSITPAPTSYVEGMALAFKNATQNTGAVSINVNGLGAKSVLKSNGTVLAGGNLKLDSVYTVRYNGTSFILQGEGASGNAVASDLLSGKTAGSDAGDIVGTIVDKNTTNGDAGVVSHHLPAEITLEPGVLYVRPNGVGGNTPTAYKGDLWLKVIDAEFIHPNIKQGVNIFGIVGSLIQGKKFATGTVTLVSSVMTVTGLTFLPSMIVWWQGTTYFGGWTSLDSSTNYIQYATLTSDNSSAFGTSSQATVSSTGFSINLRDLSGTVNWIAYE